MAGAMIPIYLFPEWLKKIAYFLPFQAIFNVPLSIYVGKITGYEILVGVGMQLFWLSVLAILSFGAWKIAEKKIIVHGG
jgi:ABC-2 type transport system permease protein